MVQTQIDLEKLMRQVDELGQLTEEYQAVHQKIIRANTAGRFFGKRKKKVLQLFDEINTTIQLIQSKNSELQLVKLGGGCRPYQQWLNDAKAHFAAASKHADINMELQALYKLNFLKKIENAKEIKAKLEQLDVVTEECITTGAQYNETIKRMFRM